MRPSTGYRINGCRGNLIAANANNYNQESLANTAANIQKIHATALEKKENSFTRKLKENREAYRV